MTNTTGQTSPKRIMGVFAHPDDPEFFCGATFARWAAEGAEITFVIATSGDKGSSDPEMDSERLIAIREEEERASAAALGVHDVVFLRFRDGEVTPSLDLRREIVRMIRARQPDTVVTFDPTVFWFGTRGLNHPDHRAVGEATLDAVYPTARDRLNFPEMERDEGLPVHKVKELYLTGTSTPTHSIDVTDFVERKIDALRCHVSQIADMEAMAQRIRAGRDPESPEAYARYVDRFRVLSFDR